MISLRRNLDSRRFWNGVAYFGWAIATVWLFVLYVQISDVRAQQARETAVRVARADAAYQRCLDTGPLLTRVNVYLEGVRGLAAVLLSNSEGLLAETPPDHPMRKVRVQNYRSLEVAVDAITGLDGFPVPTAAQCKTEHVQATRVDP